MANELEHLRWNDPYWSSVWPKREALTDGATEELLRRLELRAGERVVDVGSGAGAATMKAAARVEPGGSVTGVDLSVPLVEYATARARDAAVANVAFTVADVQVDPIPGAPYGVAMSQFGVMFFDEPARAFANLAAHLEPGSRLGFSCWRAMAENPWFVGHALVGLLPPPPEPPPGKSRTGPFALAERERVEQLLTGAGFAAISLAALDAIARVPAEAVLDDHQLVFMGVAEDDLVTAREAAYRNLEPFAAGDGWYEVPLAYWVVTAVRP